ncbi:transcriptional regulator with XRE-family HTH domain [Lipingzhangella halophila]|uniref:Transcriptional regulator with XRE-family HTH domain n=1 Tax=Lipingzhangella halophila TaxID=1783352 RepID=A0A7W7W596_9ACTN|nr:helix-turn-helix transcriptional regulator [Lipingzhangella halophila]MBB4933614.1 transcriptional regulator with XRE-family HTH domain [Lipingzhangella halophila]
MANERWQYYGSELRRLRAQAGLTQRQLGSQVGLSHAMVGALERAIRVPTRDYSDAFDSALATGGALTRIWNDVTGRRDVPEWFKDVLTLEQYANEIREFESLVVPGMLQTEEYARHLESNQHQRPNPEIVDNYVETRIGRLPVTLENGALMTFVIPERVLRHQIGDVAMMRRQLGHIAGKAEGGEFIVQVLVGAPCLAAGPPFRLMDLERQTVGYAESADGGVLVDHPHRVAGMASRFVRLQSEALPPGDSVNLIRKLEDTYASALENE